MALGPRAAFGALQSLPQLLSQLPSDLNKLTDLIRDPRPLQEKQAEVFDVVETRVADFVEKGVDVETQWRKLVAAVVPDPLKQSIPEPLRDALFSDGSGPAASSTAPSSRSPAPSLTKKPPRSSFANNLLRHAPPAQARSEVAPGLASWTIDDSEDEGLGGEPGAAGADAEPGPAELEEARAALGMLRAAVLACQTNQDPALHAMLRVNVQETESTMRRRLKQLAALCEREGEETEACGDAIRIILAEAHDLLEAAAPLLRKAAA
ncbi:hypothetical protein QBZ16_003436 [Prototheca wickerhamii]|uniref:Uncharacterized protein n=1 Tax=Prototheca wickerhamii TaxID=3111 RepID=A0AAD9IJ00_PROWI|nr:hypothetical protein QBZ16_003436 [Prototheca wickerhamii]